jgi:hypothetical protein
VGALLADATVAYHGMVDSPMDLVERLAEALDGDDYATAASVMADRVEYAIGERRLRGPDSVVASYRGSSETAHRLFDRVEYGHHVVPTDDPNTFRVSYSDTLSVAGETLEHMAEQHVTVVPGEGVVRIVNVDLPGERERVDAFMRRHGLRRE